jgi:hypothetical protein
MTAQDRPAFIQALALLAETLGQPLSDMRAEGYFAALHDLELDDVLHGIDRAMRTETFPVLPTPGKLRELTAGNAQDEAEGAWLALAEAIRSTGYYRAPNLPASVLRACDAVYGGWQTACRELPAPSERGFEDHRRRFLAAYRVVQFRQAPELPARIVRLLES